MKAICIGRRIGLEDYLDYRMEKLIELLNEYRTEKGERNLNEFEVSQTLDSLNYLRLFIKWLVDNDKIDTVLFANELNKVVYLSDFNFRNDEWFYKTIYKQLLMLLSIQDNPIEFLISILK